VRVIPGRSGTMAPYGYFEAQFSDCKVPEQWLRDGGDKTNGAWDFAVIPIPASYQTEHPRNADRLGYFGLKCFTDAEAAAKASMLFVNTLAAASGTTPAASARWKRPTWSTWSTPRAAKAAARSISSTRKKPAVRDRGPYHGRLRQSRPEDYGGGVRDY
jgi:hypothetical protein